MVVLGESKRCGRWEEGLARGVVEEKGCWGGEATDGGAGEGNEAAHWLMLLGQREIESEREYCELERRIKK